MGGERPNIHVWFQALWEQAILEACRRGEAGGWGACGERVSGWGVQMGPEDLKVRGQVLITVIVAKSVKC